MDASDDAFSALRSQLDKAKAQDWPEDVRGGIASLLQAVWPQLQVEDSTKLYAWKLSAVRIESPEWDPPVFKFSIERHGATVNGSTRAEVHDWAIDLDKHRAQTFQLCV